MAEIEAFGKSPDKRVHRLFRDLAFRGSWRQEVRDTSYREIAKRDPNRLSAGTRGSNHRNREKPRKEARHRQISDRGFEESETLDIRTREIPSREIPIRDIPRRHQYRPSLSDTWRKSGDSEKFPKRKAPSANRDSGHRETREQVIGFDSSEIPDAI